MRIFIIGATSAIARAYARREAAAGARFYLAARDAARLAALADDLRVRGAARVDTGILDVSDEGAQAARIDDAWQCLGDVDAVLLAHGSLPDQARCSVEDAYARAQFDVNATHTIALMSRLAARLHDGATLAVLSSVAGDRIRAQNALYGRAKAAVDAHARGLRPPLSRRGVNVLVLKPGPVDSPMTAAFAKGPLWSQPDDVAGGIQRAIARRQGVAYLPWYWGWIMRAIRLLPGPVFRRLQLR